VPVGRGGVLWAGAEECGRWNGGIIEAIIFGYLLCCNMTTADRNDLMPAQEKLEWVTPKILLMDAGDTEGKGQIFFEAGPPAPTNAPTFVGPS
jgi:hypothetical protein